MIFAKYREVTRCERYSIASAECAVIRFIVYLFREFVERDNVPLQEIQQKIPIPMIIMATRKKSTFHLVFLILILNLAVNIHRLLRI